MAATEKVAPGRSGRKGIDNHGGDNHIECEQRRLWQVKEVDLLNAGVAREEIDGGSLHSGTIEEGGGDSTNL